MLTIPSSTWWKTRHSISRQLVQITPSQYHTSAIYSSLLAATTKREIILAGKYTTIEQIEQFLLACKFRHLLFIRSCINIISLVKNGNRITSKASATAAINLSVIQHTKLQITKATSILHRSSSTVFNSNIFQNQNWREHTETPTDIRALLSTLLEKEWLFLTAV